jgi:hypothetical protein
MEVLETKGERAMLNDESVQDIQERMRGAGELLLRLSENPEVLGDLRGSLDREDLSHFRAMFHEGLGGFEMPPDKCNPYVQVVITILKPPKYVRRCEWVPRLVDPAEGEEIALAVRGGIDPEAFRDLLDRLGLIRCWWERESQDEIIVADKFVQGMCPPGSF